MLQTRVFPTLLFRGEGLWKGTRFADHKYVGDALNAVRIYTTKQVDELVLLDIGADDEGRCISPDLVQRVAMECMMPLTVGGGVRTVEQARDLMQAGAEKVSLNSHADPALVAEIAAQFGSQAVVVSIDAKAKGPAQWEVVIHGARHGTGRDPVAFAREMETAGAGEILLTAVDREGTGQGYDTELIRQVAGAVGIPVIANGGAGTLDHLKAALDAGATALTAGSMFVFHGRRRAVLINFPTKAELEKVLG